MIIETGLGQVTVSEIRNKLTGKTVYAALSVPYAKAGRFEKPEILEDYPGWNPVNRPGTLCFPQHGYPLWMNTFFKNPMMRREFLPINDRQTEDAFVVNIWTDGFKSKKPVLVFIHGGGEGSGTVPLYTGEHIAEHGIVAVTITYRIGVFGYLPFFEKDKVTANLAYYDQQAALIWIRKNIGFFGGDDKNITLMGHCGGGLSSLYQFLNPTSNKQFDKLILCAGNLPSLASREEALVFFKDYLKRKGLKAGELKTVSAKKLIDNRNPIAKGDMQDGDFFTEDPSKLLREGRYPKIPVLIGSNSDEFSMVENKMYYKHLGITVKSVELDQVLKRKYGAYGDELKKTFEEETQDIAGIQTKIMELLVFHNSAYQLMKAFSKSCPVYGYRLHYAPNLFGGLRGAYHGAELALFFNNMDKMDIRITEKNKEQVKVLQNDWLDFIKNGDIPLWERFDETGLITDYDDEISSVPFPHAKLLDALEKDGLCERERKRYQKTM